MARGSGKSRVLLVEGNDDLHVMYHLMEHYQIPEVFAIEDCKGVDLLLQAIPVYLDLKKERLGILVDADENLLARWDDLLKILRRYGYEDLPDHPDPSGTIVRHSGKTTVGIWLMPDNKLPGKLEDFVRFLVPHGNALWTYAAKSVEQVPDCQEKFKPKDRVKALVHTWLAWQHEPGVPMGYAINRKYLDASVPEAQQFVTWVRNLFL